MSAVLEKPKRAVVLSGPRFKQAEYVRRDFVVDAEEGTVPADLIVPEYWAHVAESLTPYDRIEVRLETGEWMQELLVVDSSRSWAKVQVLHHHDLRAPVREAAANGLIVAWKGPHLLHCVIRTSDGEILFKEIRRKEDAIAQMSRYEQVVG